MTSQSAISSCRGRMPGDERGELRVGDAEVFAVALLEVDARAQVGVDALEVRGVDRQSVLVLLAGVRDDAEIEMTHDVPLAVRFHTAAVIGASSNDVASAR